MAQFQPTQRPLPQGTTDSPKLQNLMALMQASQGQSTPESLERSPSVTSAPATSGNTTPRTTLPVKSPETQIQQNPISAYRGPKLSRPALVQMYGQGGSNAQV